MNVATINTFSPVNAKAAQKAKTDENPSPPAEKAQDPSVDRDSIRLGHRKASWMTDAIAVAQFAGSGFLYKNAATAAAKQRELVPPFSDAPEVRLEDPLLIAPGWTTLPEKFDNLVAHLTRNGENGARAVYLKEGVAYSDKDCTVTTEVNQQDRVFIAVYDDVLSPPDITGPQLSTAASMIKEAVGPKVDLVGYSMGGIAVRKMLDSGDQKVDQVAFLGAPHQGTRFAALADYVIKRDIKFAMKLANINAAHLPTMAWMKPVDPTLPEPNEKLGALNKTVARQISNSNEMLNIGGNGLATITKSWGGTEGGDGLVEQSSLQLDGVATTILAGRGNKQHGALPSDTDVFKEMMNFFDWQPTAAASV